MPLQSTQRQPRTAIYARVSSSRQEINGSSLGSQIAACRAYCAEHGYRIVDEFADIHTGTQYRERPGLTQLRELVRAGGIDVVVTYETSRLSRIHAHFYIMAEEIERADTRLEFVIEAFEDTALGRFIRDARSLADEVENEKRIDRVMRGKLQRAKSGRLLPTGRPLYGYRWRDETHSALDIAPLTGPVVQRVFLEITSGGTLRGIARGLTEDGIPTPTGKARWVHTVVRGIIVHPNYTGNALAWAWRHVPGKNTVNFDPENGVPLPTGTIPALVDIQTWEAAQQIMRCNQLRASRRNKRPEGTLLRGDFARCGYCGGALWATWTRWGDKSKRKPMYMCVNATSMSTPCSSHAILAETLDNEVWETAKSILMASDNGKRELGRPRVEDPNAADLATVDRSLQELGKRQTNLVQAMDQLDIPEALDSITTEISRLGKQYQRIEQERKMILEQRGARQEAINQLQEHWEGSVDQLDSLDIEEKRALLTALGIEVKLYRASHDPRYAITAELPVN